MSKVDGDEVLIAVKVPSDYERKCEAPFQITYMAFARRLHYRIITAPQEAGPKPWSEAEKQALKNAMQLVPHKELFAELYQVCGALDADSKVLDNISAAIHGEPLPHKTLLPYITEQPAECERCKEFDSLQPSAADIERNKDVYESVIELIRSVPGVSWASNGIIIDLHCDDLRKLLVGIELRAKDENTLRLCGENAKLQIERDKLKQQLSPTHDERREELLNRIADYLHDIPHPDDGGDSEGYLLAQELRAFLSPQSPTSGEQS